MAFYDDHLKAVALRYQRKLKESGQPKEKFATQARKTLLNYGWTYTEVERIMKIVLKD